MAGWLGGGGALAAECAEEICFAPAGLRRSVVSVLRAGGVDWAGGGLVDVHHVVAAGLERAAPGRMLMGAWFVALHDPSNAAVLPRWFHQRRGLHRVEYLEGVNRRLVAADGVARRIGDQFGFVRGRRAFLTVLQRMGDALAFETGDAVTTALQVALRRCDPGQRVQGMSRSGQEWARHAGLSAAKRRR